MRDTLIAEYHRALAADESLAGLNQVLFEVGAMQALSERYRLRQFALTSIRLQLNPLNLHG